MLSFFEGFQRQGFADVNSPVKPLKNPPNKRENIRLGI